MIIGWALVALLVVVALLIIAKVIGMDMEMSAYFSSPDKK